MKDLNKIDDKAKFENAYHAIMRCAETFFRIAPNIPKNLCEVVQHIHGRYDRALYYIFDACNTYDKERKINDLYFHLVGIKKKDKTKIRDISLWAKEGA